VSVSIIIPINKHIKAEEPTSNFQGH